MSPRHRGRGRHGGGNGAGGPGNAAGVVAPDGQGSVAGFGAAGAGADVFQGPADEGTSGPQHVIDQRDGNRPNGGGGRQPLGVVGDGRPGGQRREPRVRSSGRVSGPGRGPASIPVLAPAPGAAVAALAEGEDGSPVPGRHSTCTLAQMRRFIKSRPYVPVHELRRRFEIEGIEDEVSPVATERGTIYVGLPPEQAQFLGDLIRSGDVGCEMLLDPDSPGVIGVFPMRPVARQ